MNRTEHCDFSRLPPVKYLLVDDREDNLLVLAALLRRDDVEILMARSALEALELLLVHEVALAFLDVQMPEIDGFELAELIRGSERTRHVPLIFVTAGPQDRLRLFKGYETGAVDFLYKPIEPHILRNKAEVFFQLHRQRQQLACELKERTETLRLNELFVAVLGHDLRSPLGAILMSAAMLPKLAPSKEIAAVSDLMVRSCKRMGRMIEDVLDLERARLGGGIVIKSAPTDLGQLIDRAVEEHAASYPEARIDAQLSGDLSGCWDADRLAQLIANLLGNALRHGQQDSTVEIRADGSAPDKVLLSVVNSGRIAPELLPHIFDPFRGKHDRSGRGDGLGLGLYISQQIATAHRGRILAHSSEEGRTLFQVEIPRA